MCHSVGVSFTSSPSRSHALGHEVDREVGRRDDRDFGCRHDAPQCGPQAREQFTHPERFGDVVIGARVQRGDLVAFGFARRQDHDRHFGPAPQPFDDLEPRDVGEPEVEHDEIGPVPGGELQRDLAGPGRVDRVAARLQVRHERAQDLWFVVDDEETRVVDRLPLLAPSCAGPLGPRSLRAGIPGSLDARSWRTLERDSGRGTATRRVVELEVAVHRIDEAEGNGQAEPDAGVARRVAQPLEREEDPVAFGGTDAGAAVDDAEVTRSFTAPASTRTGASGGDHLSAFSTRFAITRSSNAASPCTGGSDSETSVSTPRARSPRLASAAGTTSSRCTSRTIGSITPACNRLMSSKLPTSALSRSASSSIVARNCGDVGRAPLHVGLTQARRGGLDGSERRPQVVRHGLQQRGAQFVRLAEGRCRRGLLRQAGAFAHRRELGRERVEHLPVVGRERRAVEHEHDARADLLDKVGVVGRRGDRVAVGRLDVPRTVGCAT